MTVFGPHSCVPPATVAEKVSETTFCGIKGMLEERQITEGQIWENQIRHSRAGVLQSFFTQLCQQHGENKCASIVVCGIALSTVRDGEDRVLQHPRIIGQPIHVMEFQCRQPVQRFRRETGQRLNAWILHSVATHLGKTLHVTLRYPFPDHLPGKQVSTFTHGMAYRGGIQKFDCLLRDGSGILEGHQRATAVV